MVWLPAMRVTILGSGTSGGVPMIGCTCAVCTSGNPKNRRMRPSAAVEVKKRVFLLDTSTDLREQALRFDLPRVDAVLYTHAHADHIHGVDELRAFNVRHLHEIPCYGNPDTLNRLRNYLQYIFDQEHHESFRPFLSLNEVQGPFTLSGVDVVPVPLFHGKMSVLGYRIGGFAYLTDANRIPDASWKLLEGLELLVLDALRPRPHATHFSLSEAVEVAAKLNPQRTVFTHVSHMMEHEETNKGLPKGMELAYDGMTFILADPEERSRP
jgi:phosphoribosyl 1,2-cyclic phosphate phosphodiesterase